MSARKKTPDVLGELLAAPPPATELPWRDPANAMPGPRDDPSAAGALVASGSYFVSFGLGKRSYALALPVVEKVLRMVAPSELPAAPSWVLGAVNLRGEVVPVVDLGRRLGGAGQKPRLWHRLVVAVIPPRKVALMVDSADEVIEVGPHGVEPPTGALAESRLLAGIIRRNGKLVMVLDPKRLGKLLLSGCKT